MDFDFGSDDEAAYRRTADAFLDWFDSWASERFDADDGTRRANADMFLDWNHGYRHMALDNLTRDDLDHYMLSWLPRKYAGSSAQAPDIVHAVQAVIEFLSAHDELDGGAGRAASLIAHTYDITDQLTHALDDSVNFGTGKSLLNAALLGPDGGALPDLNDLLADGHLSLEELQPLLEARMDAFNDLPFEERKRLTDSGLSPQLQPLPFAVVSPDPIAVEASAQGVDIVQMVDGFVTRAAQVGIALTSAGNIKLADARSLVDELETGDSEIDVSTSLEMRWLTLVDDLASQSGAVDRMRTTIRADLTWLDQSATDKASRLAAAMLHGGFLSSAPSADDWWRDLRQLLDDGVAHWVSYGLPEGSAIPVDDITTQAIEVVALAHRERRDAIGADHFDEIVLAAVGELLQGLERFGLFVWHDRQVIARGEYSTPYSTGGEIELTALGRHVFPDLVRQAGYSFEQIEGIEEATVEHMIQIALMTGLSGADVLSRWRIDLDLGLRMRLLADCVMEGGAPQRILGFDILGSIDDPAVVPIVRQLLDSPAGAYAATYLLDRDLAASDEVGAFIDLTPIVDMLWMSSTDLELFNEVFQGSVERIDGDFIEELWRHDQEEVLQVLDTAGKHVTDKAIAKSARKAALKHRSWLANQGRST